MNIYLNNIKKKIRDLNISTRIIIFYSVLLVISIAVSNSLYSKIYSNVISKKISEVSVQTLSSINSNFSSIFESINNYYLMLFSNLDLQEALSKNSNSMDVNTDKKIQNILLNFYPLTPEKSSVYIIDNNSNFFYYSRVSPRRPTFSRIQDVEWFEEVRNHRDKFHVKLNAAGFSEPAPKGKYISFIRGMADINSIKPIGIVVFDISTTYFEKSLKSITKNNKLDIAVYDRNNENIIEFDSHKDLDVNRLLKQLDGKEYTSELKGINGHNFIISGLKESNYGWKIVSVIPFDEMTKDARYDNFIAFVVILINSLFLFVGSLLISRMITTPIKKLLASMKDVKKGEFKKVRIDTGNNEFGRLIDGYNTMISEIEKLITRVIEEQKIKRKAELNVLQEQIKPHFLYNSFDSISSLILSERNSEAYKIMESLKDYYKTSLSKGSEIITIEEEIGVVKNYLIIQKARFGDKFDVNYDIDERVLNYKILKLVLQPLVENSIHHGIRQKRGKGTISISARFHEENIQMVVEDDGIGMEEEIVNNILIKSKEGNRPGFGLRGTIERLNIFYGIEDALSIESSKDKGTRIIIKIPLRMGE